MSSRFSFDTVTPVQVGVPDIPDRPAQEDLKSANDDVRDAALSSGGGSSSGGAAGAVASGDSPEAAQEAPPGRSVPEADVIPPVPNRVDSNSIKRGGGRKSTGSRAGGAKGRSGSEDTSVVRVPASLAQGAVDMLHAVTYNRSDAVAAILYAMLGGDADAPDDIKNIAEYVPARPGESSDLRAEVVRLREEVAGMTQLLKQMQTCLLETQSIAVWLLGERLGSPGTQEMSQQSLNIAFSDAELIRKRIAMQTQLREEEARTRRGREIEDEKFRKSQRERER